MNIYSAFSSEASRKAFIDTLPPPGKMKYDGDILIPVVINTKQLTEIANHYKKFLQRNQQSMYLTYMFQHGTDAARGPYKFVITSLWAIKKDIQTFKDVGVPFPIMAKWYNSEADIELLEKSVKLREFDRQDIGKYIHYANVYLTEDKAYVLHYKGQH